MDKLNIFDGYLSLKPGTEDRLTWALMNLIRMSPIIRAAFLDLVRDKQEQPIPALTTLRERKCVVPFRLRLGRWSHRKDALWLLESPLRERMSMTMSNRRIEERDTTA